MSNTREWSPDDRFVDRRGTLRAQITSWSHGYVNLRCWGARYPHPTAEGARPTTYYVPESYWLSDFCGWRKEPTP